MAETYKGLTIQIGADVTSLRTALKSVDAAARTTQSNLKKIEKGLSWNPESIALTEARLKELASKSIMANAKLAMLGEAMKQMKSSGIAEAAANTRNVELRAKAALDNYNAIDNAIARLRMQLSGLSEEELAAFSNDDIDAYIRDLSRSNSEIAKGYKQLEKLKASWQGARNELTLSKQISQFKDLRLEIDRTEAAAASLAREYVKARQEFQQLGTTEGIRKVKDELKLTDEVADKLEREMKQLDDALKMDPRSIDAYRKKLLGLRDQTEEVKTNIKELKSYMKQLESAGASKSSKSMSTLARETQRARAEVEKISAELAKAEGELEQVTVQMRALSTNGEEGSKEFKQLKESATALEAKIKQLSASLKKADTAFDTAHMNEEFRKAETEVTRLTTKLVSLSNAAKAVHGSFSTMFYNMRTVGMGLSATVSTAATMAGMYVIQAAEDIDSAYRDMRKTVQGTEEQFEGLKEAAIEYSKTHITDAATILEIQAMAGQLGIAAENLEAFSTTVSNLDISTDDAIDAETIATDLGKLINVISDLEVSNVDKFADSLTRLGNNEAALESDILNITTRFGAMGSMVNMSADEILAWATAATATGVKAESAGSNMQKTIGNINSAVAEGGKKLDTWSKYIGMTADEIKEKWGDGKGGSTKVFKSFIETLSELNSTKVDAALKGDLGIGSVRQRQLIEGLTQEVEKLDEMLVMSEHAWNGVTDKGWGEAGDAANEAAKKTAGFTGAIETTKNVLKDFGSDIGDDMIPVIEKFKGAVTDLSNWYKSLSDSTKSFMIDIAVGLAILGPGLTTVGVFGQGISKLLPFIKGMGSYAKKTAINISLMASSMKSASAANASMNAASAAGAASMGKAAGSASKLGKAASSAGASALSAGAKFGIAAAGISAAALLVYSAWSIHKELAENQQLLADAAQGTKGAFEDLASGIGKSTSEIEQYNDDIEEAATESLKNINTSIMETARGISSLSEELSNSFKSVNVDTAKLNKYQQTIDDLSGETDLSSQEIAKLKLAIEGVNDACGTTYEIDEQTGAIKNNGEAAKNAADDIRKLVEAKKLQLQVDAMSSKTSEAMQLEQDASDNLAKAIATQKEMEQAYYTAVSQYDETSAEALGAKEQWLNAQEAVRNATDEYNAAKQSVSMLTDYQVLLSQAISDGSDSFAGLIANSSQTRSALETSGQSVLSFEQALSSLGIEYKDLSDEAKANISTIASEFDGSVGSVATSLSKFGTNIDTSKLKVKDFAKYVKSSVGSIDDTMVSSFEEKNNVKISKFCQNLVDEGKKVGVSMEDMASITGAQWEIILANYNGSISDAVQAVKEWADANKEEGEKSGQNIADGVIKSADEMKKSGQTLGQALNESFSSADFASSGSNAAKGLADGSDSKSGVLYQAGYRAAASYLKGVKSKAVEKSPWHTTQASGRFAAQGLQVGSDSELKNIERAGSRAATAYIDAAKSAINAASFDAAFMVNADVDSAMSQLKKLQNSTVPVKVTSEGSSIKSNTTIINVDGINVDNSQVGSDLKAIVRAAKIEGRA